MVTQSAQYPITAGRGTDANAAYSPSTAADNVLAADMDTA
jgi:hypothetical protein